MSSRTCGLRAEACHRALADCEQRAQGAHGGVEPAEQPVDPFIASNQAVARSQKSRVPSFRRTGSL